LRYPYYSIDPVNFFVCQPFYVPPPGKFMDEQFIQKVRDVSREIVANEFPDEEEYFDFLFDLTIQEIEDLEPGKEMDFLREIRVIHPELALGFTPIIIILTVQILGDFTHDKPVADTMIKQKIADILGNNKEKIPVLYKYFEKYRKKGG
jgi:hypothetical protein